MQLDRIRIGVAHLGDFLALDDGLPFLHQQLAVVGVHAQIHLVVLDDHELAVTADAIAAIKHLAGRAGDHRLTRSCRQYRCL